MVTRLPKWVSAGRFFFAAGIVSGAAVIALVSIAFAEPAASPERTAAAIGHYAKARALLVQAIAEFEEGRKLARPDLLLDAEEWRISVASRTEELNRLLDPQPRVTRSGARYEAYPDLIRDAGQKPLRTDAVSSSNAAGEVRSTPKVIRKPLNTGLKPRSPVISAPSARVVPKPEKSELLEPEPETINPDEPSTEPKVKPHPPAVPPVMLDKPPRPERAEGARPERVEAGKVEAVPGEEPVPAKPVEPPSGVKEGSAKADVQAVPGEDPEITAAINRAIQERLERMNKEGQPGEGAK